MNLTANINKWKYDITSMLMGIITTFATYVDFGSGDHVEQLPLIYRCIDSNYLRNDFFVNAGDNSMARYFFAKFMAVIAMSEANLPTVFFITTILVNIVIAYVSYRFAKKLFNGSSASGLFASAAVMFVSTFSLGWNTTIYHSMLIPAAMAAPLLFGAIWAVAEKKFITTTILCLAASAFHPLMGLEMSAIIFFSGAVLLFVRKELTRKYIIRLLLGVFLLLAFAVLLLYQEFSGYNLQSDKFIYILAYFRHPHHYLPSVFGRDDYWVGIIFILSAVFTFFLSASRYRNSLVVIGTIVVSILLLCVGGYLFVEVIPVKLWTIAQTFRLLYFVKWIGIILIAGVIPHFKTQGLMRLLYLFALVNPYTTIWVIATRAMLSRVRAGLNMLLADVLIISVVLFGVWGLTEDIKYAHIISLLLCIAITENYYRRFIIRVLFPAAIVAGVILFVTRHSNQFSRNSVNVIAGKVFKTKYNFVFRPTYELNGSTIVTYAVEHTSPDAIFLVPPLWGQFRLAAKRAIVVDFKAFPFSEAAMEEWYDRIGNCYGHPKGTGFGMLRELYRNYDAIDDAKLMEFKHSYGCSYAVLENVTNTNFEVICSDKGYKLVHIP